MEFKCDYKVYHPLGGASYVFEKDLIKYINYKLKKKKIVISIGAQPNSSPHFGTLCVFSLAFSLAKKLKEYDKEKDVSVLFEVVDTAPCKKVKINDITYQYDLKGSDTMHEAMGDFIAILDHFKEKDNIEYSVRNQNEFNSQKEIPKIIKTIIHEEDKLKCLLDPKNEKLRIRASCPKCGLVDKEGVNTIIKEDELISFCPEHGKYTIHYNKESNRLEYNTPLRNLVRGMVYGMINENEEYDYEIIRITGGDYSGFYQEELLYKTASICHFDVNELPIIVYCPQILDWSGAKLSKSLYVKKNAYQDLPKYLLNYKELYKEYKWKGLDYIHEETDLWLEEPYRLFRNYTGYYFMKLFEEKEEKKNDGHKKSTKRDN